MTDTPGNKFITRGSRVSLAYQLSVDGSQVSSATSKSPLVFTIGNGDVISGLESALYGMHINDEKSVSIPAIRAYGEPNPNLVARVEKRDFPDTAVLIPGVILEARDDTGNTARGKILAVESNSVTIDYNHPLAGKSLDFEIKVLDIQ